MRFSLLLLALVGCTNSASGPGEVGDVDPDDVVSVSQGVYGVLFTSSDVAGYPDVTTPDKPLALYAGTELVATTASDGTGIYQLELAAGRYELCVNAAKPEAIYDQWIHNCAGPCTFVDVGDAARLRADWGANLSGGWWSAGDHCPRQ
jgi:hypothetical protein